MEKSLVEKLREKIQNRLHKLRVGLNPNPTDEERAAAQAKMLARIEKKRKEKPKKIQGGSDTGWTSDSSIAFGRSPMPASLGRGESVLGIDYQNPKASEISVLDLKQRIRT